MLQHLPGSFQKFINIRFALLGLVALLCLGLPVAAQKKDSIQNKNVKDSAAIVARYPDPTSLDKFRNDSDYDYSNDPAPPENPLERWFQWLMRWIDSFFGSKSYNDFWQYVIILATVCIVIYLLYKAKVLDFLLPSARESQPADYIVGQENIHEINFDDAIQNALSKQDFRLAIRLQYLQILKLLTGRNLIHWKPNLTNQTYVQELEKTRYHSDFAEITRYFEFAWYGDFEISESGFKEMKAFSDSFVKNIGH
jgi:hypothetical protein